MIGQQYYIKKGNKYVPVNDLLAYDGLGKGSWLVVVKNGSTSIRTQLSPKLSELDAALRYLEDGLVTAIVKAGEMRPKKIKISEKEQKAWKAYKKIVGEDMPNYFQFSSAQEISEKACNYIKKIMVENDMNIEKIKEKHEIKRKEIVNGIFNLEI